MKEHLKSFLKTLHLYHPLQSAYRSGLSYIRNQYFKRTYARYKVIGQPPSSDFFECNFCGARYNKFVPEYPAPDIATAINKNSVIAGFGENVYCPNCGSKNRERLIKAILQTYTTIEGKKILHFSPEKHLYNFIKRSAPVTTADITPSFYRNIDKNILQADATNLPFGDGAFDLLIANHILEHIPEDQAAMKEMYRVLNDKGLAILQVPYSETLDTTLEEPDIKDPIRQAAQYGQKDHVRIYAKNDYIQRLRKAGFHVNVLTPERLAPFRIHAIQENESVFLCSKQSL
jgi:SAM-dependent methyltransferase